MYGHAAEQVTPLDPICWQQNETYLYAVDLFNYSYFWEAHEAWESLWHAAGHQGQVADFLKGLIKLAAAGVKQCEGNAAGVARHLSRGHELLHGVHATHTFAGVDVKYLLEEIKQLKTNTLKNITLNLVFAQPPA
jgi:predicted metal-dependent hydrolase